MSKVYNLSSKIDLLDSDLVALAIDYYHIDSLIKHTTVDACFHIYIINNAIDSCDSSNTVLTSLDA